MPFFKSRNALVWFDQQKVLAGRRPQRRTLAMGLAAGLGAWGLVATGAWWIAQAQLHRQAGDMRNLEVGYAQLIAEATQRNGAAPADAAPASGPTLARLVARNDELTRRIVSLEALLADANEAAGRAEAARQALADQLAQAAARNDQAETENAALNARVTEVTRDLTSLAAAHQALTAERASLRALTVQLQQELAHANQRNGAMEQRVDDLALQVQGTFTMVDRLDEERQDLRQQLAMDDPELRSALASAEGELQQARADSRDLQDVVNRLRAEKVDLQLANDALQDQKGSMQGEVTRLRNQLAEITASQEQVFASLRERSEEHVAAVEGGLELTGLDIGNLVDRLHNDAGIAAAGGPMVPTLPEGLIATDQPPATVPEAADLNDIVDHATDLRLIASKLPLSVPLDVPFRLTSGFGVRHDPFNGHSARHEGLDFAAPLRTPVHVTAPGTVTFAGRRGAYGNMVEVQHGLGISTRYGHLHTIEVEVGQHLDLGDEVGLLGSTGRSTGPHVHYEVRVDGVAWNPVNFVTAGQNLLEIAHEGDAADPPAGADEAQVIDVSADSGTD